MKSKALEDLMCITNVQSLISEAADSRAQHSSATYLFFFSWGELQRQVLTNLYMNPTAFTKQTPHAFLLIPASARRWIEHCRWNFRTEHLNGLICSALVSGFLIQKDFLSCLCVSIKDKMIECPAEKFIHTITMMGYYNKSVGSLLYLWRHYSRINWKKQCLSHPTDFRGEAALLETCTLAMILWNILFKMRLLVCHCKCFSLHDNTSPMSDSK